MAPLHCHVGWSTEMPLMQMLLDVSGLQIGDGTPQIQKLIIARELLAGDATGQEMIRAQTALAGSGFDGLPMIKVENACASASSAFQVAQ